MRTVRVSRSYLAAFHALLAYGEARFGRAVVDDKRARVERTIANILRDYPGIGRREAHLGVYSYPVTRTPFVLLYDYDDYELRIHLIVHARADRTRIVLGDVEW
jgi:plasmid stabilization system protein ParE